MGGRRESSSRAGARTTAGRGARGARRRSDDQVACGRRRASGWKRASAQRAHENSAGMQIRQPNTSPMTYVRQTRLDGVRADLQRGVDDTKVSDVAFSWGFNHLGRFAQNYERKFGESPSHTLRAALKS